MGGGGEDSTAASFLKGHFWMFFKTDQESLSEPSQITKIELFEKIAYSFRPLTIFIKSSVLDVLQCSWQTSVTKRISSFINNIWKDFDSDINITIMFILRTLLLFEANGFWLAARQCHFWRHKWHWRFASPRASYDNNVQLNERYYYHYC